MNTKVSRYQLLFNDERNELKFKQFNEVYVSASKGNGSGCEQSHANSLGRYELV